MSALGTTPRPAVLPAKMRTRQLALFAWLERDAFPITAAALYAVTLLVLMPFELVQDSWATLVTGRVIALHGLPHRETLTVMAHGARWIDQQWLGQLAFYELFRAGGFRLILFANVLLETAAFALAVVAARRRGASPLAVAIVAFACFFVAPWGWQLRAQSFAPLLFVAVLALLLADSRSPSRRVFLVLPLLAVWANLHGSVVLAAALVALYGATRLVGKRREAAKGIVLVVIAPLAVLCSPYGFSLVHYYRHLLIAPPFGKLVVEWMPPTPAPATAFFYALAFGAVWAVARWGRRLTWFERLALLVTLASALTATRNILWFGLTALVVLPLAVDEVCARASGGARPLVRVLVASAALVFLLGAGVKELSRPGSWYTKKWPDRAAAATIASATRDPSVRVLASDRYADWLLWRFPSLSGRVAFDIRFELNSRRQIQRLSDFFGRRAPNWDRAVRGYRVIVLDRGSHDRVRTSLVAHGNVRQIYTDKDLAVLVRGD